MQGKAKYIGICISGTPQFIYDERRGLFSYEALRSRLADSCFGDSGFVDYTSPVIKLSQLTAEEIYVLLERLCELHVSYYNYECKLGEDELKIFLSMVQDRLGADQLLTPREVTRDFLGLLNILYQNPEVSFDELIHKGEFNVESAKKDPEQLDESVEELFAEFDI